MRSRHVRTLRPSPASDALRSNATAHICPMPLQDPGSDFLGEESALVYPPAGRSFGGGPSAAARTALGAGFGGGGGGGLIDPMDDFRFRGGGARKAITVEQLGEPYGVPLGVACMVG